MSAVLSGLWTCSRTELFARTVSGVARAALVSAHSARQFPSSIRISDDGLRLTRPQSWYFQNTRAIHTTWRWKAPLTTNAKEESLSSDNARSSSKYDTSEDDTPSKSTGLTQADLNAIFGQEIDRNGAAELLSQLQRQRREGRLDEYLPYPGQLIDRGLEYLRAKYPVDEDAAIIARVDREMDGEWSLPQRDPKKSRSAQSGLMEIRRLNKAKREAEEAEEAAQVAAQVKAEQKRSRKSAALAIQQASEGKAMVAANDVATNGVARSRGFAIPESHQKRAERIGVWMQASSKRVEQLRKAATMKYIPQMTRWQRLWPSGVFTLSAVGLALIFAFLYTPPSQKARLFPDVPPAVAVVGTIITLNVLVYLAWRIPYWWRTMNRYFMIVPAMPKAFSMLGAPFSHQEFFHLCGNMLGIGIVGAQLHNDIGRGPFLALVVCGSVIPSFCALFPIVMKKIFITSTLGASGLLTTMIATTFVLHEGRKVTIHFLPPEITSWMNTAVVLAALISVDAIQLMKLGLTPKALINSGKPHFDYVGHLAGYATGIGAACWIRQTDPYWGSVQRQSFWRWKDKQREDPAAEVLMKPESLGIKADTSKS